MKKNVFNQYFFIASCSAEKRTALYDTGVYDTSIKYQDKKRVSEKEKAARVLHYFKLQAVRYLLEKVNAGGLQMLNCEEYFFLKKCFDESITIGTGKMKGINSISTAVFLNAQCLKNAKIAGSICFHCYAARYASFRPSLARKLELNTALYCAYIIPVELLPVINAIYFRFESFGDLMNTKQQTNYFNICNKNSVVKFAQWSKSPKITAAAISEGNKKPDNLQYIYSLLMENSTDDIARAAMALFGFIDKCFIVYDPKTAKEKEINCGGRDCLNCNNCYNAGGNEIVREKRK